MMGHGSGAASQYFPRQQTADQGVGNTDPRGCYAKIPAELAGIAHENHRGKIGGAVGKTCKPGTYTPAAQHKATHVVDPFAGNDADGCRQSKKNADENDFDCHNAS